MGGTVGVSVSGVFVLKNREKWKELVNEVGVKICKYQCRWRAESLLISIVLKRDSTRKKLRKGKTERQKETKRQRMAEK